MGWTPPSGHQIEQFCDHFMHECHLKICQCKYDKGHHANPTMAIDLFMDPNMLTILHQIYLEIFIP
jgi:hypothetical protein